MPEKRGAPLNNPSPEKRPTSTTLPCPYCTWVTTNEKVLAYHVSRYHEDVVVEEGKRVREKGRDPFKNLEKFLLSRGYIKCQWSIDPCGGYNNPIARMVCKHLEECPQREARKG